MLEAEFDSSTGQSVYCLTSLHRELAQFIARHPLLRILKSRTELEERAQIITCFPGEYVDQPSAAGRSSELSDLGSQLAVAVLLCLGNKLLPSLDEVIGREGVQLIRGCVEVHEVALLPRLRPPWWRKVDHRIVNQPGFADLSGYYEDGWSDMIIRHFGEGGRVDNGGVIQLEAWLDLGPIQHLVRRRSGRWN
jgi:hypothetical protein